MIGGLSSFCVLGNDYGDRGKSVYKQHHEEII